MEGRFHLIGNSQVKANMQIKSLDRLISIASNSDANVLITGQTGTGKSTLARHLHGKSKRKEFPFVSVNLASLHEGVLESELFGHEKGAFTGADQKRMGRLEQAQGGTVFLDEVSELSPRLQARLLEFLQSRTLTPVGSNREIQLDVRVITATHKDLNQAVRKNEFREDLFHRLRVISIPLQSLQERGEDLDTLIHDCLDAVQKKTGRSILRLSSEVAERFEAYHWPGNLRELNNVLEFAVLASDGPEITLRDLPDWILEENFPISGLSSHLEAPLGMAEFAFSWDYPEMLRQFEKEYLTRALSRNRGRVNRTAKLIGMNKTTLIRRMRAYGISVF